MSPITLTGIAFLVAGAVACVVGQATHVESLKPSPKGITVMVYGGGDLFDAPFPEDTVYRELERLTEYTKDLRIGRIITRGSLYGEKIAMEWADLHGVEIVKLAKARLFENIYETMISAGQPDVIIQLAGKSDDWSIVRNAATKAGFETAYWWALASTLARPAWITDDNSVERPEHNKTPRQKHREIAQ